jgi:tetratricopeptide (TPR) repeat protein
MKVLTLFLIVAIALLIANRASAQTLDDANRAFVAGQYHTSTHDYQAILARDGYSAPVLFNLGNSLYREGDFAGAILAYQRAQWLAPGDADIGANLQAAQKQAGITVAEPRWSDKLTRIMSASGWAWLGAASWTVLCLSLLARAFLPQHGNSFGFVAIASGFILTTSIAGAVFASDALTQAVITDNKASALISPFPNAQVVFSPAAGETVTIKESHNDFVFVTDHNGHSGWVSKSLVTPIVPS